MAMMWRILVAALVLGSLGCDTEVEKQQALEAEKAKPAAEQTEKQRQVVFAAGRQGGCRGAFWGPILFRIVLFGKGKGQAPAQPRSPTPPPSR